MSNQAFYLHYSSVIASLKKKKAKQERKNKSVKIKKLRDPRSVALGSARKLQDERKEGCDQQNDKFFVAVSLFTQHMQQQRFSDSSLMSRMPKELEL